MTPIKANTIRLVGAAQAGTTKIAVAVMAALLALSACGTGQRSEQELKKLAEQLAKESAAKTRVDFSRIKLADRQGHELDPSVIEKPLETELKVTLDGQTLAGESQAYSQLSLCKKLGAKLLSKLDGSFLFLPFGKSTALVGGFAAICLEGKADKILICGGDESPNHVRFAADRTWLVDLTSGKISVGPDLHWSRRLPTLSTLNDGRVLISGGSGGPLSSTPGLNETSPMERLPLQVEIYDPKSNEISAEGNLQVPRDQTAVVVLKKDKVLIAGGDRPRAAQSTVIAAAPPPLTAEVYDLRTKQSTLIGPLLDLTEINWAAPVGDLQALLMGPKCELRLDSKELSLPEAQLIDGR